LLQIKTAARTGIVLPHEALPLNSRTLFAMTGARIQPRMGRFGVH
jgi:hypothetical protein